VIVIDEYLAVRVTVRNWPDGLPDNEQLVLPARRNCVPPTDARDYGVGRPVCLW